MPERRNGQVFSVQSRMASFCILLAVAALLKGSVIAAPWQAAAQQQPSPSHEDDVQRYEELLTTIRDSLKKVSEAEMRFFLEGHESSFDWRKKWEDSVAKTRESSAELREVALRMYFSDQPNPESLDKTIIAVKDDLVADRQWTLVARIMPKIREQSPDDMQLKFDHGVALLYTNQFEAGCDLLDTIPSADLKKLNVNPKDKEKALYPLVGFRQKLKTLYEEEQKILAAEADGDLPRVKLETSRGPVVVELFENQAPGTVGNFIYLVEDGFYTNVFFHRVIQGFMAQVGLFGTRGPQDIGYTIYDECEKPGFRRHFTGYLSMAKTDRPHSGNSQFFITYTPTLHLDGKHTVFGRVVEGMENVERLIANVDQDEKGGETVKEIVPDRIISATVLNKRDHAYQPNKVGQSNKPNTTN